MGNWTYFELAGSSSYPSPSYRGSTVIRNFLYSWLTSRPGAHFSKLPIIDGPVKLLLFTCKIEVSNQLSFASNMIKLSVNETKWSILLARTRALIFLFRFEYLISVPKSYRDFRETGPRAAF